MVIFVTDRIQR